MKGLIFNFCQKTKKFLVTNKFSGSTRFTFNGRKFPRSDEKIFTSTRPLTCLGVARNGYTEVFLIQKPYDGTKAYIAKVFCGKIPFNNSRLLDEFFKNNGRKIQKHQEQLELLFKKTVSEIQPVKKNLKKTNTTIFTHRLNPTTATASKNITALTDPEKKEKRENMRRKTHSRRSYFSDLIRSYQEMEIQQETSLASLN